MSNRVPLAILCPMKEELNWLLEVLAETQRADDGFYRLFFAGRLLAVLAESGVGKVNTATCATRLALQFKPNVLLMLGCAASLQPQLDVGSLVLVNEAAYHDVHAEAFGYATGQLPGEKASFICPETGYRLGVRALKNAQLSFTQGLLLSGDQFVEQGSRELELIRKNFPKALMLEMEGAALAHVAERFNLPWMVLRVISDSLCEQLQSNKEQFKDFFRTHKAQFIQKFFKELLALVTGESK